MGLPQWLSSKESPCDAGDTGDPDSITGSGRSRGEGNGYPFQYSCLGNPIDREAWWATVQGVTESGMSEATKHAHTTKVILPAKWRPNAIP